MRGRGADARCERLETLADGDDKGAGQGRAVDPFARGVEGLQTGVRRHLEEVAGQHAIFVRADALRCSRSNLVSGCVGACGQAEGADVGVFDDF